MSNLYPSKFHLDDRYKTEGAKIQPNHLTLEQHDHNVVTNLQLWRCVMVLVTEPRKCGYDIVREMDLSRYVIDYSYDCSLDDNTRTSASVTLIRQMPKDKNIGFGRRESDVVEFAPTSGGLVGYDFKTYACYELVKTYYYPETGQYRELGLGYFWGTSNNDTYSPTDNTFTLSLINVVCLLQPEFGGTPNRYRTVVQQRIALKQIVNRDGQPVNMPNGRIGISQRENTSNVVSTQNLNIVTPTSSSANTTTSAATTTGTSPDTKVIKVGEKVLWHNILASPYIKQGQFVDNNFVYQQAMGSWAFPVSAEDQAKLLSIKGVMIDTFNGVKVLTIPENKELLQIAP